MSLKIKVLWVMAVFCIVGGAFWAQENKGQTQGSGASSSAAATPAPPSGFVISPEDAAKKNPVRFTDASVDRGKKVYMTQCALCHGEKGDGKGDLAKDMNLNLSDFTKPDALASRTDGELFAIIETGKDPMPSQKGRMPDRQLWNLVNYLRALSGKVPAKATAQESADENIILVPQEKPAPGKH
jgi:mono/diheme cytochrome c family protein